MLAVMYAMSGAAIVIAVFGVVNPLALVGMVAVGVLAAVWPARRAARTDVLRAIASE